MHNHDADSEACLNRQVLNNNNNNNNNNKVSNGGL
jgi:hypothetical protein